VYKIWLLVKEGILLFLGKRKRRKKLSNFHGNCFRP